MKKQANPRLSAAIFEVVDSQLRDLNPPEAKETYDRLVASGLTDKEARRLIAVVVTDEIYQMLKFNETFNLERYIASLRKLPAISWE